MNTKFSIRHINTAIFIFLGALMLIVSQSFALEMTEISGLGPSKNVKADLILPDGNGPFPAVLVLHTSGSVQSADIAFAKQLANYGFACLVPYYFDAYGIGEGSRALSTTKYADNTFDDFTSEINYLKTNPRIRAEKIGAVGFSMGGYWALVLAAKGSVQAGVSYYGAISGGGKNLDLKYPLTSIFTKDSAPVLILHGSNDTTVPVQQAERLAEILDKKNTPYELKIYDGSEHRFERETKGKATNKFANTGTYDANVANDSWDRTLKFLGKYLK
ncbi:MAG: dienelactone hydrolase family protein [Nitrospirae bacterium]|nr:dienelactone hydrolase family protein [Nitrospirota bacterium]